MKWIFKSGPTTYFWSTEGGEVCVNIRQETPAEFFLDDCETGEPVFIIVRFNDEVLYEEAKRIYTGRPRSLLWGMVTRNWQRQPGGEIPESYYRDGSLRLWSQSMGEIEVEITERSHSWTFLREVGGRRRKFEVEEGTDAARQLDQVLSAERHRKRELPAPLAKLRTKLLR